MLGTTLKKYWMNMIAEQVEFEDTILGDIQRYLLVKLYLFHRINGSQKKSNFLRFFFWSHVILAHFFSQNYYMYAIQHVLQNRIDQSWLYQPLGNFKNWTQKGFWTGWNTEFDWFVFF
jgi:hypothetical protein